MHIFLSAMKVGSIIRRVTKAGTFIGGYMRIVERKGYVWYAEYLDSIGAGSFRIEPEMYRELRVARLVVSEKDYVRIHKGYFNSCMHKMTPTWEKAATGDYDVIKICHDKYYMYFTNCEFMKLAVRNGYKREPYVKIYLTTRIL